MSVSEYYTKIIEMLQGRTPELQAIPYERLDWAGSGAVLELYKKTSGSERVQIVDAMERILKEGSGQPPAVTAQLVHIAASLDIAQLEPAVKELASKAPTLGDPVRKAVDNFLAFRQLRSH